MKSLLRSTAIALALSTTTMIAVPTLSAQAAVPTDASLLKLIKVTKVVEMMDEMADDNVMIEQVTQAMLASMPDNNMTKQQRQSFDKIISKYIKELVNDTDMDSLNRQTIKIYIKSAKKHYNQQEVDAQITFYSSNIGQSIIDKQPNMTKDYIAEIMPIVVEKQMQSMKSIMPLMIADIEALMIEK